jgi:hypothetical protein
MGMNFAELEEQIRAAVMANDKREHERLITQMSMNDDAMFSRLINHRKIFYPAVLPAVNIAEGAFDFSPNDATHYAMKSFKEFFTADFLNMLLDVPAPPVPEREKIECVLPAEYPRGYHYYGYLPEGAVMAEPKQLTSPCGECPFRNTHDLRFDHRSVVDKVMRTELLGHTECHMAQHLTCEGGRRFLLKQADPIILPTTGDVIAAHSNRPDSVMTSMFERPHVEPVRERSNPHYVMLGDVEAIIGQF